MKNAITPPLSEPIPSTGYAGLDDVLDHASLESLVAAETCLILGNALTAGDIVTIIESLDIRIRIRQYEAAREEIQRSTAWLDLIPDTD